MPFDDDDVRWLLELLEAEGLQEIEVRQGELRIRVRARDLAHGAAPAAMPIAAAVAPSAPAPAAQPAVPAGLPVPAPMAGIFYRQPSPDADPFVEEGDRVLPGDVVGLIEVMKLFNEITAPVAGVVTKIAVENQERVEENQPLLYIQPASSQS